MQLLLPTLIITGGTEAQKQSGWARLLRTALASYAVTEPGAGSDVAACKTTAIKDGDNYIINGEKMWITEQASQIFLRSWANLNRIQRNVRFHR